MAGGGPGWLNGFFEDGEVSPSLWLQVMAVKKILCFAK